KPTVTAPPNVMVNSDPNQCSALVNPGTATPHDNCPGSTVSGVRSDAAALNAPYPIGATTITWSATDAHGNTSTTSAIQTVTVVDSQVPSVTPITVAIASLG